MCGFELNAFSFSRAADQMINRGNMTSNHSSSSGSSSSSNPVHVGEERLMVSNRIVNCIWCIRITFCKFKTSPIGCCSRAPTDQYKGREMHPSVFQEIIVLRWWSQQIQKVYVWLCICRRFHTGWSVSNDHITSHQRRSQRIQCGCIRVRCNRLR